MVEDLYYGAVAVAQRLEELAPESLILVGAEARGRRPGSIERRLVRGVAGGDQNAVEQAVTGYVSIDLVLRVAASLRVLPAHTVTIEVEPVDTEPSEHLSRAAQRALWEVVGLVETEARRAPMLVLADQIRQLASGDRLEDSPALETLRELLAELELLDTEGRWGRTFMLRDRLRLRIAQGETSDSMDHIDWSLWWTLIEELDRLPAAEAKILP